MAVVHHFHQQAVAMVEVLGLQEANHICSHHKGYLNTMENISGYLLQAQFYKRIRTVYKWMEYCEDTAL